MKHILALTLCILTLFLCACQPTPDVEPVPNKGDDVMGEKIHTTPVPKTPDPNASEAPDVTEVPFVVPHIDVPEHWTEEMTLVNGTKIYIDADIEYEDVAHPVYLIKNKEKFDGPTLKKLLDFFGKDFKWRPADSTREELLERLEELMREDDPDVETDDLPPNSDDREEAIAAILEKLQELDPETHWEDIKTPEDIPTGLSVLSDGQREIHVRESGSHFRIDNFGNDVMLNNWIMIMQNQYEKDHTSKLPVPDMAKEDAVRFAKNIVKEIGMEDHFEIASVYEAQTERTSDGKVLSVGWEVVFGLKTGGATPLTTDLYNLGGQFLQGFAPEEEEMSFKPSFSRENLILYITDGELGSVIWARPQEIVSIENPAVELMSFDTIKERIKKRIEYGLSWTKDSTFQDVHINKIFLTYLESDKANAVREYYYTPMWCFTSSADVNTPLQEGACFINAIDGTFVKLAP